MKRNALIFSVLLLGGVMLSPGNSWSTDDPVLKIAEEITPTLPGATEEVPAFIQEWKAFAETTGKPEDQRWVELITYPNAVKLSNAWSKWRGFDAPTLVKKGREAGKIPAEVKPGLVITAENVDTIPGLKEMIPGVWYARIKDKEWYSWKNIRIVPTSHYYFNSGKLKGFIEEKGEFSVDPTTGGLKIKGCTTCEAGKVLPEDWGQKSVKIAFAPTPKDGLELAWTHILNNVVSDNLFFKPIEFILCDANNKIERTYSAHLWWQNFWGRSTYPPTPAIPGTPGTDYQGGAVFFTHPLDVKGLSGARIRHFDPDEEDYFPVFVPFLKRTRILAGSDTQDPMCAGCDVVWDDWRAYWQRMDARQTEYKLEGEGFVLAFPNHGMVGDMWKMENCSLSDIDMEIRPVWKLGIYDKTGKYVYSKRVIWVDKDWFDHTAQEIYDRRGNLWKGWSWVRYWDPRSGEGMWRNAPIWDHLNKHLTLVRMNVDFHQAMVGTKKEYFDIESLKNYQ